MLHHGCKPPAVRPWARCSSPASCLRPSRAQREGRRRCRALAQAQASGLEAAAGEFAGVTATFRGPAGAVQPVPEHYVPGAYREWGVEVLDWQTQCSTKVEGGALSHRLLRLMPTVGCEADAVAFTEAGHSFDTVEAGPLPGSYLAARGATLAKGGQALTLEACFPTELQHRLRVVMVLGRKAGEEQPWALQETEVHREQFTEPYNGGTASLAGCGGGLPPFAASPRLEGAELEGAWQTAQGQAASVGPGPARVLLPLGAWAAAVPGAGEAADSLTAYLGVVLRPGAALLGVLQCAGTALRQGSLAEIHRVE